MAESIWEIEERKDFQDLIGWAGTQDWSNGNVGRAGSLIWLSSSRWPPEDFCLIEGFRRSTNR